MAANIRGITIEIGGDTSKFEKSLRDVNKTIKDTQSALKDVDKLLKLDPKNTELLTQKQKLLKDAIGETEKKLSQLRDAQGKVEEGSKEWDALQREIVDTEQKLKGLEDQYKSFGSVSAQQIKAAGEDMKAIGGKISDAGRAFAPVSAGAAAAVGGLGALGYKAVTAADELNTLSKQTGISTDDLQKMQYASDLVDVSLEDITGSLRKMKNNMDSTSSTTQAAWDRIGVSTRNADGSMRDATEVFYEAIEGLSQIENETERDQVAMDLFGKSADSLAGIIDDGGAAFQEYGQQAEDMGLILSGETLNSLNSINDTLDQTKATVGASLLELGATIAESLQPALDTIAKVISDVAQKLGEMDPQTVQMIATIGLVVAAIGPLLIFIGNLITAIGSIMSLAPALGAVITALTGPIGLVIAAVAAAVAAGVALYKNWDTVKEKCAEFAARVSEKWNALKDYITDRINTTKENVVNAWNNIKETVTTTVENLKTAVTEKWDALKQKVLDTVENIKKTAIEKWNNLKQTVTTTVEALKTAITEKFENIKTTATEKWENIKTTVTNAVENLKKAVSEKIEAVKTDMTQKWENIKTTISNAITGAKDKVTEMAGNIKSTITTNVDSAVQYLKDLPSKALRWGRDLIDNFIDGIRDAWRSGIDFIEGIADDVADFIGFSEPEKGPLSNFHTFAPDMMSLFAKGIRENLGLVTDAMNDVSSAVAGDMNRMAMVNVTSNTFLNGRMIASEINHELGAML